MSPRALLGLLAALCVGIARAERLQAIDGPEEVSDTADGDPSKLDSPELPDMPEPVPPEEPLEPVCPGLMMSARAKDLRDLLDQVDCRPSGTESFLEEQSNASRLNWPEEFRQKFAVDSEVSYLGKGAFGKVYRTHLLCKPSVKVAVKTMESVPGREYKAEAETLNRFKSYPGFIHVIDVWPPTDRIRPKDETELPEAFIAMEFADGNDLTSVLKTDATEIQKMQIFYDIAHGIVQMHRKSIIHRDLKPDNVLVTPPCTRGQECHGKVADLGLACSTGACEGVAGTPLYMAPELFQSGRTDFKNDVWSLGLILYELLLGSLPKQIGEAPSKDVLREAVPQFQISTDAVLGDTFHRTSTRRQLLEGMLTQDIDKRWDMEKVWKVTKDWAKRFPNALRPAKPFQWPCPVEGKDVPAKEAKEPVPEQIARILEEENKFHEELRARREERKEMQDYMKGLVAKIRQENNYLPKGM